jgi:hypothetical protein
MLDGVFECRNNFLDVRRQLAPTLDEWPQRDRRGKNQRAVQRDRIEIIVEKWSATAMKCIARPSHTRSTVPPMARPPDVGATLVGEKHVCASIEALCVPLQAPRGRSQRCQIGVVRHNDQHVDVLWIQFGRHDRAQNGNSPNASNLAGRREESAQSVEQRLAMARCWDVHRLSFNRAMELGPVPPIPRSTAPGPAFAG